MGKIKRRQANKYNVPRIAFINKMDRTGANFARAVQDIREKLGGNAWPVLIPIGAEDNLKGQLDVLNKKAVIYNDNDALGSTYTTTEIPAEFVDLVDAAYADIEEQMSNLDDVIAEKFLNEEPISVADLKAAIRRQTHALKFVPVAGGSAFKNKGVQGLLDAVVDYLPNPLEAFPVIGQDTDTEESVRVFADDNAKFCSLAFKLWSDKFVGKLVFFRVYSGTISKGDTIYNARTGRRERVSRLILMRANKHEDIETCYSGDIAALVGIKDVRTGDTLCSQDYAIHLEPPSFPEPVISMAVEPKTRADQEKMGLALQKLAEEDPTFRVFSDEETGQTIIAGMGELHLDIIVDRMKREHKVETTSGAPQIAYRETITNEAMGEGKLVKQSGGRGQYGHVILKAIPQERGKGITVENKVVGGTIPKEYINACKKGVLDTLTTGVLGGYEVIDVHVDILDGSYHDVDSNEQAFQIAASMATKDALARGKSFLLEPIMKVEVETPDEFQGDIMGDLNRRRGRIMGIENRQVTSIVTAEVPLSQLFGYVGDIRTMSKGRASYSMDPSHFEQVPANIAKDVLEGKK